MTDGGRGHHITQMCLYSLVHCILSRNSPQFTKVLLQTVSAEPLESESERGKEERKRNVWRREGCEAEKLRGKKRGAKSGKEENRENRKEEGCKEIKRGETLAGRDKKCDHALKAENEKKGE